VIRLVPPMVCIDNEIDQGLTILEEVFAGVAPGLVGARDIAAQ
jgi:4-aminobutyrate aminotransferase-like enzyme